MDIFTLRSDIRSILDQDCTTYEKTNNLMGIMLSASWPYTSRERVEYDDLQDRDFRILAEWCILNRRSYDGRMIAMIRDMREVFPGLSLAAAVYIVRGR